MNKKEIGREAELEFQNYLNQHKIPFWFIEQERESYSQALKQYNVQRPDYCIFIPNLGFILIDVEHNVPLKKYRKFCISDEETQKYNNLEKYFNMKVWFAFSNQEIHYTTWYLIPVSRVMELRNQYLVKAKNYISTPIDEFIQVSCSENLKKIFKF